MSPPLVSVIIPTCGRPQYLPKAVQSALHGMGDEIETIVVPNGPDDSWKEAMASFGDARVRVFPIGAANANAARNHGLSMARGTYVRFLDDDDLLYPQGAKHQLELLARSGADIASAPIDLLLENGRCFAKAEQPGTDDFVAGAMRHDRLLQVTAHLFKRQLIDGVEWDESLPFCQDIDWMLRICGAREISWVKSPMLSGGWRRHTGKRTTVSAGLHRAKQLTAEGILRLVETLEAQDRLTPGRRVAAASGLWDGVHRALFLSPEYWSAIAAAAEGLHPGSHPDTKFFTYRITKWARLTPLQWEKLLAPKRLLGYGLKRALLALRLARTW